jgi:hypothetical protein
LRQAAEIHVLEQQRTGRARDRPRGKEHSCLEQASHRALTARHAPVAEAVGGIGHDYATGPGRKRSVDRCVARRLKSRYSESMSSLRDLVSRLSSIAIPGDLLLLLRPARR